MSLPNATLPAREIVEEIMRDHGFLDESTYADMPSHARRKVEEAMLKKDEMIGSSVITLAKNLYNSSARFVFELLQNADDNSYLRARSLSAAPFVSFHVYHRRIVVECNEDGFTPENLKAICNVGRSSKTGAQGYIGEKGIGFKSVFMVAWKVRIQSGDFSFYFQHKMGDSGMGMISPVWEDTGETLARPLTRITLFLHEAGLDELLDRQQEATLQQFRELQATFLLFMKNLQRIEVTMYDKSDTQISSTTFSMETHGQNRVELKKRVAADEEDAQYYHITKDTASGLPKSENRTYTAEELSNRAYANADVVLAFPLTQGSVPIVEAQDVFAFLPIRNMGFPFLIHSDFVTDASRQDIVRNSGRNDMILKAIGEVFVKAVSQFCEHPTIRYQWMRFLPSDKAYHQDKSWTTLMSTIHDCLQRTPALWTRSHKRLRLIKDMRRVPKDMLDENGEPLFPDLEPEEYLASEYSGKDLGLLKSYGLCQMGISDFLVRVLKDLTEQKSSIMKSPETSDDWHSRVAKILLEFLPRRGATIKSFKLIPLAGGAWKSSNDLNSKPIYCSRVNGYNIPPNLGLDLLDSKAERNHNRKRLFDCLGVQQPEISYIRAVATIYHTSHYHIHLSNLRFLYLTAHLDRENDCGADYGAIRLFDHMNRLRSPETYTFYFPDQNPYSAQQLLQPVGLGEPQDSTQDLNVSFLHDYYLYFPPIQPNKESRTWRTWLSEVRYVRDSIPLTRDGRLSKECLYVAKQHPEKFLGFLLNCWKSEGREITENRALTHELLNIEVLCENGNMCPLGETYMHTKQLEYADRFIQKDEPFPWLKREASLGDIPGLSDLEDMTTALGFGYPKSELDFYLTILRFIKKMSENAAATANIGRVYELYGRIESRCHESANPDISRETIWGAFCSGHLLYVPAWDHGPGCWTAPEFCLWEAPANMVWKYPLKWRYGNVRDAKYFAELFQNTLAIPDASIEDLLNDLEHYRLRYTDIECFDHICNLYRELDQRRTAIDSKIVQDIRTRFERGGLIYYEDENSIHWYKSSECLWSTVTDIKGMVSLNSLYEDLQNFFVEFLDVRTLTLQMVHNKLIEQASGKAPIRDVKETIWLFNSYLQDDDEETLPSPKQLLKSNIFPVKYPNGTVNLCSSTEDFAIQDRKPLSRLFSGKAKFLDFEVNDIPRLEPFLRWTGLETRYLSSCVKEISALCSDYHQPLTSPDRKIARKAHGLLRIAVHFRSPRAIKDQNFFYDLLKRIDVRETDGISSEIHLNQDGNDISVEVSRSELHLHENEDGLTVYVPRDEESQYICFVDRIPWALLEWIMKDPTTGICEPLTEKALNIMQKVLSSKSKYVASILERLGIMSVETPEDPVDTEFETTTSTSQSPTNTAPTPLHRNEDDSDWDNPTPYELSAHLAGSNGTTASSGASHTPPPLLSRHVHTPRGTMHLPTSLSSGPEHTNRFIDSNYRRLLYRVVSAAREAVFSGRTGCPFDMRAVSASLDSSAADNSYYNEDFWIGTLEKTERDKRIGAAGELFVFEVLSRLNPTLPGFSRDNWQSTIRKYARLHDEYSDMQPWQGRETADFTYTDTGGGFTSLLIEKGYLSPDAWTGKRPQYFIEVKSTTASWDTPFYMSKHQYKRAQNISRDASDSEDSDLVSENLDAIYVIFRVFNLSNGSIGMKIYVDPNVMRQRGELAFTAETWSIVPGPHFEG